MFSFGASSQLSNAAGPCGKKLSEKTTDGHLYLMPDEVKSYCDKYSFEDNAWVKDNFDLLIDNGGGNITHIQGLKAIQGLNSDQKDCIVRLAKVDNGSYLFFDETVSFCKTYSVAQNDWAINHHGSYKTYQDAINAAPNP